MVKIQIAPHAGFCMGVRRAVNLTLDESRKYKGKLQTLGALIHNPQIVDLLERRGTHAISQPEKVENGKVIIRAHGVSPAVIEVLKRKGVEILDATCPHVARIHKIIRKHVENGDDIVIVGDKGHAEVTGLEGSANGKAFVISSEGELDSLPALTNPCLVAQTTQSVAQFKVITERMRQLYPNASVYDTICRATEDRQAEIISLAAKADLTLVVGGKNSANTQRLVEVARLAGSQALAVEDEDEVPKSILKGKTNVLVAAGASTPTWMIHRVALHLKKLEYQDRSRLLRWIVRGFELLSSAYLGLGITAMLLSLAMWTAAGENLLRPAHLWIVFSYIVAMYALNHLTNIEANQLQEIFKREPINRFRRTYIFLAVGALVSAFALAFTLNFVSVLFVAFCEAAGIVYNLRIFPARLTKALGRERIKDIPLSKDLGISFGWTSMIVLLPLLSTQLNQPLILKGILVGLIVAGVSFLHALLHDLQDLQKDMFVGRETIPMHLGRSRTWAVAIAINSFVFIALLAGIVLGVLSAHAWILLGLPVVFWILLYLDHKAKLDRLTDLKPLADWLISAVSLAAFGFAVLSDLMKPVVDLVR